ncbi:dGTP triphosphohydrolase [Aliterella atlantica]|uniref:Deoxyguanosinetriphosphate triphosphohydrolase n=1 Tax=Aliterella atlantica CENA595 TaxID=1618023 RepID=A0A0D8ZVY3_9CYAN|nr:dNTP triphosphohydrolase [Aliterella atlantica]KJH72609.1 deoxyguanosinetriphosphate triphosphohydrolase [Aliterella atlantica CENA595]
MQWSKLLSSSRLVEDPNIPDAGRTVFEKDFDKIIFSSSFRRLKDKTQVFSLVENDYIRSRLSHSLEASCVGRTLGTLVGSEIIKRHTQELQDFQARDFGDIVAAACLAHDIGNPPFGHAGEDAIQEWFKSDKAENILSLLSAPQQADFKSFEGNAQGFRILTELEKPANTLGVQFTCATLATFTKYPREAGINNKAFDSYNANLNNKSTKKHGFFQAEKDLFARLANEVGLIARNNTVAWWCRHPLTFLVEAADDICYHIVDLEDGLQMGNITYEDASALLQDILAGEKLDNLSSDRKANIKYLRAKAIHKLITEVKQVFLDCEPNFLDVTLDSPLTSEIASGNKLKEIIDITRKNVYESCEVVEVKVAGYEVIGGLLEEFITAIAESSLSKSYLIKKLIPNFREDADIYTKVLQITDYIAGMTDSFAVSLFKKIKGISLPRGGRY